jgi:hypothetical protein
MGPGDNSPLLWTSGEGEIEGRPFVHLPFCPHPTSVPVDDTSDDGKTDSRAFKLLWVMEPLKDTEQSTGMPHIESDSVVFHVVDVPIFVDETTISTDPFSLGRVNFIAFDKRLTKT